VARPVFFDLRRIGQPVTAVVSFGHRVSGVVLALVIPIAAWLLQRSLRDPDGFSAVVAILASAGGRIGVVLFAWALAHHLFAGVRHLLFDFHVATGPANRAEGSRQPRQPRASAWLVLAGEAIVVLATIAALA
jgi:succinate dehydrogenase / fumarate reductase cytochrome b subunit